MALPRKYELSYLSLEFGLTLIITALKVAEERKSAVLAANAYHHRVDSLTAFVALLMIGGANVVKNAQWMDPVGGLVISLMVIQAGWGNTRASIMELADSGVDDEMKNKVRRAATKALGEASSSIEVREIQGMKAGQTYLMEVELAVPSEWSVSRTREIEDKLRTAIGSKVRGVKRVKVRFVPNNEDVVDFKNEFVPTDVSPRSSPEPEAEEEHNHPHHR